MACPQRRHSRGILDLITDLFARPEWRSLLALMIGLLIGAERERRKGEGETRGSAGLRTFGLVALLGALAAESGSTTLVLLAGSFTAAAALLGYALGDRRDPGLTSEVALVVTFVLGVLVQTRPMLALAASVVVTVLLACRDPLHRLVRDVITRQELLDGLTFSVAALVVLPLLPDRALDPFGLFNPFTLWRLAVVLMGLSALGYTAQRLLGPRYGLTVAGFASGFVSSSASIAAMGERARADARLVGPSAAGAIASILGSLVYLLALVVAADPGLFRRLVVSLGLAAAAILAYTAVLTLRAAWAETEPMASGRAFNVWTAVLFAALVAIFALISTALTAWLGTAGALAGAAVTGLADAHATAVSLATLSIAGKISEDSAALAILIGLSANMVAKAPVAFTLGPRAYAMRVTLGLALLLVGVWGGYAWELVARTL